MYTFIHVTKTGGTALERYFYQYFPDHISGYGHYTFCTDINNPIIVIREPVDRFLSMYKYWKKGSEIFSPENRQILGIKDFIKSLRSRDLDVLCSEEYLWEQHYAPTYDWIQTSLANIIAIKYTPDLASIVPVKLCQALGLAIPFEALPVDKINVSRDNEEIELDEEDLSFIKDYYKHDFMLWETLCNNPECFKIVIEK